MQYVIDLAKTSVSDIAQVGGKNASLGEMIQQLSKKGIKVPGGFATTITAYHDFLSQNALDKKIEQTLANLNINDLSALKKTSTQIQRWIINTPFSNRFIQEISHAYRCLDKKNVAVRSSATAEDLAAASFAGQQETFLNINGLEHLLPAY